MKRWLLILTASALVALAGAYLMAQRHGLRRQDPAVLAHGWLTNLDEGMAQARQSGKPVMVVLRCEP